MSFRGGFGGFGQSAAGGFGGFGQTQAAGGFSQPSASPAFGAGCFGQPAANTFGGSGFGQSAAFGGCGRKSALEISEDRDM